MLNEPSVPWVKEVEDYEARMFEYFSQCSVKLREWYNNGGKDSEAYSLEYNRVSEEYQQYVSYIKQLRDFVAKSSDTVSQVISSASTTSCQAPIAPLISYSMSTLMNSISKNPESNVLNSTTTAATCYTQYYQEMIGYFEKILSVLEHSPQDVQTSPELDGEPLTYNETDEVVDTPKTEIERIEEPLEERDMCCDPRAVMEQYFEQFGETGKWDWASWNNYLSWIARSNPQWYAIFLEYSQSIGIDWDQMYNLWKMSDPVARQSFEEDFVGLVGPAFVKPPTLNQSVYHGLLFGNPTELNHGPEDNDTNEFYCRTCHLQFQSERAFTLHFRGVTHIQRALEGLQRANPERLDRFSTQESGDSRHYAWFHAQYMQKSKSEFVRPGSFYCELCQVQSTSIVTLQAHLTGRRHQDNVMLLHSAGTPLLKDKRPSKPKSLARLQTLLDVCTQPLIGLNYLVERQFGEGEECAYFCELCNERTTRQEAIKHVCGVPHRTNYMKSHYPDMCGIIANDNSIASVRLKRIEFYARKIEDFEGRKRVKIKQLSAFDSLRRIWRPQDEFDVKFATFRNNKLTVDPCRPVAKPVKKSKKIRPKVATEDLEEGEITEDSSDEEISATSDGDRFKAPLVGTEETPISPPEEIEVPLEELIPLAVATFRPTSDCEAYIATLKTTGVLNLGLQSMEPEDTNTTSNIADSASESALSEAFEREAQWVLDRVRAQQSEEENSRRQYVMSLAEASETQPTNLSLEDERKLRIQRGLDVVEEKCRLVTQSDTSTLDVIPSSNKTTESDKPSIPESTVLGLLSSMDPNRQRMAMSNGAVEIILSALGALRDSGQLPNSLLSGMQGPTSVDAADSSETKIPATEGLNQAETDSVSVVNTSPTVKEDALTIKSSPFKFLPGSQHGQTALSRLVERLKPIHFSIRPKTVSSKLNVEKIASPFDKQLAVAPNAPSVQVTANPNDGLLSSASSGAVTIGPQTNSQSTGPIATNQSTMIPNDVPVKRAGVGLLGHPLIQSTQPNCLSKQTFTSIPLQPQRQPLPVPPPAFHRTQPPSSASVNALTEIPRFQQPNANKKPNLNSEFEHTLVPSTKVPVLESLLDSSRDSPDPVNAASAGKKPLPPSIKFASYMQTDLNGSQDTMFDAYALYSRRSDERSRPRPLRFDRGITRPVFRGRHFGQPHPGRKLSVIADMLGVNEPPAPRNPAPRSPSMQHMNESPAVSQMPLTEPPYLLPVASFSVLPSPRIPHISYYIPKNHPQPPPPPLPSYMSPRVPVRLLRAPAHHPPLNDLVRFVPGMRAPR